MALLLLQCLLQPRETAIDVIILFISDSDSDSDSDSGFVSAVGDKQDVDGMPAMRESDYRVE